MMNCPNDETGFQIRINDVFGFSFPRQPMTRIAYVRARADFALSEVVLTQSLFFDLSQTPSQRKDEGVLSRRT
jgi:hypothetical protein